MITWSVIVEGGVQVATLTKLYLSLLIRPEHWSAVVWQGVETESTTTLMTSLSGLQGGCEEKGGEAGRSGARGSATHQRAIAFHFPLGSLLTGNNKRFYFQLCYFLFPSRESIWIMLSINFLLKRNLDDESLYCSGTEPAITETFCLIQSGA